LLPIIETLLQDVDEAKSSAIINLSKIIAIISENKRETLLEHITKLEEAESWRIRQLIAKELVNIVDY